jgi:uncharacterized membrane protein YeaQ/YmgE (transglycosylase-associated protein family)
MHFVYATIIGLVIGAIGGFVLRSRHANAIWLAPVLAVVGSLIASGLAAAFGDPGYGIKEFSLQVVLALAGVGAVYFLASRSGATTASPAAPE